MNESFILNTEIVLDLVEISCKIVIGTEMSNQNRVVNLNWRTLFLEAEVGINVINNPSAVNGYVICCKRGFLFLTHRGIDSRAQRLA